MNEIIIKECVNKYPTPIYLYDQEKIEINFKKLKDAVFPQAEIFYSMKANPLLGICQMLRNNGSGIEVASKGEMYVALQAGFAPENIVFTSPGKTMEDIKYAIDKRIKLINVESFEEAELVNEIAATQNQCMAIALRINPQVVFSNAKIKMSGVASQFGIEESSISQEFINAIFALKNVTLMGIQVYMGTDILLASDIIHNTEYIINLAIRMEDEFHLKFKYLNMGGGFGIPYFGKETSLDMDELKNAMEKLYEKYNERLQGMELIFESGRYIMAEAGVYVTKVLYRKKSKGQKYLVCDGGSNFHAASAFLGRFVRSNFSMYVLGRNEDETEETNITGPLCTPTDVIGQNVMVSSKAQPGDYVVVNKSGAYGLTHSPCLFLGHEMPIEVMHNNGTYMVLRERELVSNILTNQKKLEE